MTFRPRIVLFLASLCVASGCIAAEETVVTRIIPFVSLLVNPSQYAGERVSVVGFMAVDHSTYLYLSEGYAHLDDVSSAIRVVHSEELATDCLNSFVRLTATLRIEPNGEPVLRDVVRVWKPETEILGTISCLE